MGARDQGLGKVEPWKAHATRLSSRSGHFPEGRLLPAALSSAVAALPDRVDPARYAIGKLIDFRYCRCSQCLSISRKSARAGVRRRVGHAPTMFGVA
jgi:hypothetical protein